eukprot:575058-Prymnesium_polylepis.2
MVRLVTKRFDGGLRWMEGSRARAVARWPARTLARSTSRYEPCRMKSCWCAVSCSSKARRSPRWTARQMGIKSAATDEGNARAHAHIGVRGSSWSAACGYDS